MSPLLRGPIGPARNDDGGWAQVNPKPRALKHSVLSSDRMGRWLHVCKVHGLGPSARVRVSDPAMHTDMPRSPAGDHQGRGGLEPVTPSRSSYIVGAPLGAGPLDIVGGPSGSAPLDIVVRPSGSAPLDIVVRPSGSAPLDIVVRPSGSAPLDIVGGPSGAGPLGIVGGPSGSAPLDIMVRPSGSAPLDIVVRPSGSAQLDIMVRPSGSAPLDIVGGPSGSAPLECSCMDIMQDPEGAGPLQLDGSSSSLSKGALECSCDAAVLVSLQPPMWLLRCHTHAAAMPLEKPSAGGAALAPACALGPCWGPGPCAPMRDELTKWEQLGPC